MSSENADYASLGLGGVEQVSAYAFAEDSDMQPALPESGEDALRSVSGAVMQTSAHKEEVYRSLKVGDSSPSLFTTAPTMMTGKMPSMTTAYDFEDSDAVEDTTTTKTTRARRVAVPLRRKLASYAPASVHALVSLRDTDAESFIAQLENALRNASIDFGEWSASSSSLPCAVVRNCDAYCFDIYLLELDRDCQRSSKATHILEVQRISAGGCAAAWAAVVASFMQPLRALCFGGYFERRARSAPPSPRFGSAEAGCAALPSPTGLSLRRQTSSDSGRSLSQSDGFEAVQPQLDSSQDDDDDEMAAADEAVLEAEYKLLVAVACDQSPQDAASRDEVAQLLARLSSSTDGACRLASIGAAERLLAALQTQLLSGARLGDAARAYCSTLGNLCAQQEGCVAPDLAAHALSHVLAAADCSDHRQRALVREAARTLALLSAGLGEGENSLAAEQFELLRDQVRTTVRACADGSDDKRLAEHVRVILANIGSE